MTETLIAAKLETDVVHPAALSDTDVMAWRRLQAAEPAFGSPLLGPGFAQAVGAVRTDARVAVYRRDGQSVGFLAHHRRPGGFARPIGAPFCDYHALVAAADADLDQAWALASAGIAAIKFTGLVDPHGLFTAGAARHAWGRRIVLTDNAEAVVDGPNHASSNSRKNHKRHSRALEAAFGPVRIVAPDRDPAAFERLIDWKRRHLARTGLHDFLGVNWAQSLMRRLFDTRGEFEGLMISLYAGERLVAAHFGVRQGDWFHPWIGAYDPDASEHSPGTVHQVEAVAAMASLGLKVYDLGSGEDHWKQRFANDRICIGAGLAAGPSLPGRLSGSIDRMLSAPAMGRAPVIGRVRNRLDQIAAVELTAAGRLQGAVRAIAGFRWQPRRRPVAALGVRS